MLKEIIYTCVSLPLVLAICCSFLFPVELSQDDTINFQQVSKLNDYLLLDARSQIEFNKGHYPMAKHAENIDQALEVIFTLKKERSMIVVYCSPNCNSSKSLAKEIKDALEHNKVYYIAEGFINE